MSYPESLRDELPKTETYPVGREMLDATLAAAGVQSVDLVYFLRAGIEEWNHGAGVLLDVDFHARTRDRSDRVELRVRAMPSERKPVVAPTFSNALGRVAEWIRRAEVAGNAWRSSDHSLVVTWEGNALAFKES